MEKLTKREDQIMQIIWQLKTAFIRDIIERLPEPKPHYNSVATIVKILVKKGVLQSELIGNTHRYSPVAEFEEYRDNKLENIKKKFFGNSFPKMMAYFAKEENLTEEDISELIEVIKTNKSKKS
ncbi:BlaI/MecI/CopY family transcriptional regulator [Ulvibacter antarcticus]|uniref:Putative transcriptional regulator n=1 Tax=Ulvibacter antarcticus TaxID=442714 RepID=A0A3L9YX37_9FLAO|nr:BlaI/MecI/CopY family transcriptional regulator [Ulvibacter antarcticus]RMA64370.1 putative transcriptional regulator [Ulvibacter antarcticus]